MEQVDQPASLEPGRGTAPSVAAILMPSLLADFHANMACPRSVLLIGIGANVARGGMILLTALLLARLAASLRGAPLVLLAAAAASLIATSVLGYIGSVQTLRAIKAYQSGLQARLVDNILSMPILDSAALGSDHLRQVALTECEVIGQYLNALMISALPASGIAMMMIVACGWIMPIALIPVLAFLLAHFGLRRLWARQISARVAEMRAALSALDTSLAQVIRRHELAVSMGREPFERRLASTAIAAAGARTFRAVAAICLTTEMNTFVSGLLVLVGCLLLLLQTAVTLDAALALPMIFIMMTLRGAMLSISNILPDLSAGAAAWHKIAPILCRADSAPSHAAIAPSAGAGAYRIAMEQVSFGYGAERLLNDLDLRLDPGTLTVLRGTNGSGKSTIVRLLLGLIVPDRGCIRVDGTHLAEMDARSYRGTIGYLPQSLTFLPATVGGAIDYGQGRSDREIKALIDAVGLAPAIAEAEAAGGGTITESGAPYSGGQRQMVALARALLGNPRLLILDEPTNHLDRAACLRLLDILDRSSDGPPILVVTHSSFFDDRADQVLELSGGSLTRHEPQGANSIQRAVL